MDFPFFRFGRNDRAVFDDFIDQVEIDTRSQPRSTSPEPNFGAADAFVRKSGIKSRGRRDQEECVEMLFQRADDRLGWDDKAMRHLRRSIGLDGRRLTLTESVPEYLEYLIETLKYQSAAAMAKGHLYSRVGNNQAAEQAYLKFEKILQLVAGPNCDHRQQLLCSAISAHFRCRSVKDVESIVHRFPEILNNKFAWTDEGFEEASMAFKYWASMETLLPLAVEELLRSMCGIEVEQKEKSVLSESRRRFEELNTRRRSQINSGKDSRAPETQVDIWRRKLLDFPESRASCIAGRINDYEVELDAERAVSRRWIVSVLQLPTTMPSCFASSKPQRKNILHSLRTSLDAEVVGHRDAKASLVGYVNKILKNGATGSCLGLWGPPGTGKSTLVGSNLGAVIGRPMIRFNMDGAQNISLYFGVAAGIVSCGPGAIFKAIADGGCTAPIFVFEEIDKISDTGEGPALAARLKRFIDGAHKNILYDDFIGEIDLNMSSSLFVFTYNSKDRLDASFKDRLFEIEVKPLTLLEKREVMLKHIFPKSLQQSMLTPAQLSLTDSAIERLLAMTAKDTGARDIEKRIDGFVSHASVLLDMDEMAGPLIIATNHMGQLRLKSLDDVD